MNREEYESLERVNRPKPTLGVGDLHGPDRTLLYGYMLDRRSFHVYLKDGEIHVYEYDAHGPVDHVAGVRWDTPDLIPEKRVYPHATDAEFARLVLAQGVDIPWTTFNEKRADWEGRFYAPIAGQEEES